eukprot:s314_g43.t1
MEFLHRRLQLGHLAVLLADLLSKSSDLLHLLLTRLLETVHLFSPFLSWRGLATALLCLCRFAAFLTYCTRGTLPGANGDAAATDPETGLDRDGVAIGSCRDGVVIGADAFADAFWNARATVPRGCGVSLGGGGCGWSGGKEVTRGPSTAAGCRDRAFSVSGGATGGREILALLAVGTELLVDLAALLLAATVRMWFFIVMMVMMMVMVMVIMMVMHGADDDGDCGDDVGDCGDDVGDYDVGADDDGDCGDDVGDYDVGADDDGDCGDDVVDDDDDVKHLGVKLTTWTAGNILVRSE